MAPAQASLLAKLDTQQRVRDFLTNAIASGRASHAYLFLGAPGAGKHHGTDGRVGLGLVQRGPQVAVHLAGEAVQRWRAVEREHGHRAVLFVQNGGFLDCHVVSFWAAI